MARKKKEKPQAVESIEELKARLNTKFGAGTALTGEEVNDLVIEFFPTGSFALDVSLRGGIPYNRIVEIIGAESSSKTSLCHLASHQFLRRNPEGVVCHVDLENSIDFAWMKRLGCKPEHGYIFAYADSGEQAGDIVDEVVADAQIPVLVIADSIMAIVPMIEMDSPLDQQLVGKQASLINRIIRVVNSRLKSARVGKAARTTMILVNQTRPEIGGNKYAPDPGASSGGQGRKFFAGQRIVLTPSSPAKMERGTGDYKHTTRFGRKIHFQVIKNKTGGPEETGHYLFYNRMFEGVPIGVDNAEGVISCGMLYQVLRQKGNTLFYQGKALGGSTDKAMAYVRNNYKSSLVKALRRDIMSAAKEDFSGEVMHEDVPSDEDGEKQNTERRLKFAPKQ